MTMTGALPRKPKVALLLDAHRMDPLVFHQFRLLSETLEPDVAVHAVIHARDGTHRQDDRVIVLTDDDIFPPGRKAKPDATRIIPGNPDLKLVRAAAMLPGYDAFLRLESDVVCMTRVRETYLRMFARFAGYDFVALGLSPKKLQPDWTWWSTFSVPDGIRDRFSDANTLRAFLPLMYFSRTFIEGYAEALDAGWSGHYEVTMPTYAAFAGLKHCNIRKKWPSMTHPASFKATKLDSTDTHGAEFCHPVKSLDQLVAFHGLHDIFPDPSATPAVKAPVHQAPVQQAPRPPAPHPAAAPAIAAPVVAPKLTLPPKAAALMREEYAKARTVLEYGSGGSTVVAAGVEGLVTFSVESDAAWAGKMVQWFARNPPRGTVHIHHADIGPTRAWGYPDQDACWDRFIDYPLSVWQRADFAHPDVVLIDGRFRVGCFVAVVTNIRRPTRILFDDYVGRPRYHVVEELCSPASFAGRMAVFDARPQALHPAELLKWIRLMQVPD